MAHTRVTISDVEDATGTSLGATALQSVIDDAKAYVDDVLEAEAIPDALLSRIEIALASHFAALRDDNLALERTRIGDVSVRREGDSGQGLRSTRWGQKAISMDPTGTLAGLESQTQGVTFGTGTYD